MSETVSIVKRARTDDQKRLRRRVILDAADKQFREVGFEAFSMAELGRRTGVAKGTLYLYFETREELLLTLYCAKLAAWADSMVQSVSNGTSDEAFASAFYHKSYADPSFLPLMSRLDSVIEHNVSLDTLIQTKRAMAMHLHQLSHAIAPRLELSSSQAFDAIRSLGSLLLGAAQVDAGPGLEDEDLPDDVRDFMQAFSSKGIFAANARRILAGIRAGA